MLLHVLGAGPWQQPTIRRARALGHRVLATDGRAGAPGFADADLHAVADLADADATLAVARQHGIDGILCDSTDTGVLTAAVVADALGLPGAGIEAARACTDKALMGERAAAAGLLPPRSLRLRRGDTLPGLAALQSLSPAGRWVVKPADNQSGRGVRIVEHRDTLPAAVAHALANSRRGEILLQEAVSGVECIVDSLVVEGRVQRLGLARKTPYADNPTISQRISYASARELGVDEADFEDVNRRLIAALGVRQGLVHAEYLLDRGVPRPIDVAARGGGVLIYPLVLSHLAGVPLRDAAIALALGQAPALVDSFAAGAPRAANIEFLRAPAGRIGAIDGAAEARQVPGVAALHFNRNVGDRSQALGDKDDRLGFVVALGERLPDLVEAGLRAAACVRVRVEPEPSTATLEKDR